MKIFLIYLLLMNIAGFAAMGIDKCKAKAHAWRIPEKTLFGLSLLGGSAGTWAGMYALCRPGSTVCATYPTIPHIYNLL